MLHKKQKAITQTHKRPRPNTKRPHQNPQKAQAKHEKPHQTHQKARPNTTHQASPPHEMRPLGRISGGVGGLVPPQKTPKPTKRPGKTRHTKPHKPMNCERAVRHRRAALSQFGGRGGTGPPTKKNASPTKKDLQGRAKRGVSWAS